MIKAYPYLNNLYKLKGKTYYLKEIIKQHKGLWNVEEKCWIIHESQLAFLPNTVKMVEVKHEKYCHMEEGTCFVSEEEFKKGFVNSLFCSLCDSSCNHIKIISL
jgi:hypothetical protein